ncbi:MAG: helix-turn-helix transcriptional regulator [bacterium]|nr:helix-turn-helix transcriptional regulator [bacterium]
MKNSVKKNENNSFEDYLKSTEKNMKYDENRFNLTILSQVFSIMKKEGITNTELAKRMNVSRAYITKLFKGNCNFTIKTIMNIGSALDCDIDFSLKSKNCR